MCLLYFSEDPTISRVEPRLSPSRPEFPPLVWAIDAEHAPLYYFPRDCPRVAFWALPGSTPSDIDRFLAHTTARWVIAIESAWLERVRQTRLFAYHLPREAFTCQDAEIGYYTCVEAVTPLRVEPVGDLLARLADANIELRVTPSLWPLHDALIPSSLHFSLIRMRNAAPSLASP